MVPPCEAFGGPHEVTPRSGPPGPCEGIIHVAAITLQRPPLLVSLSLSPECVSCDWAYVLLPLLAKRPFLSRESHEQSGEQHTALTYFSMTGSRLGVLLVSVGFEFIFL